jgi:hypothetical protein
MRISVADVWKHLADMSIEEILADFLTWNGKTSSLALPMRQSGSVNEGQRHGPARVKLLFDDSHSSPNTIEQVLAHNYRRRDRRRNRIVDDHCRPLPA